MSKDELRLGIFILLCFVLTAGEPDLLDGLIKLVFSLSEV